MRRLRENRALAGGDEAEFAAFAARGGGELLGFAFLLTGNRHDAEDLVQQALLRTAVRLYPAGDCRAAGQRTAVRSRACWTRSSASCRLPVSRKANPSNSPPSRAAKAENSASSPPARARNSLNRLTLQETMPAPARLSAHRKQAKTTPDPRIGTTETSDHAQNQPGPLNHRDAAFTLLGGWRRTGCPPCRPIPSSVRADRPTARSRQGRSAGLDPRPSAFARRGGPGRAPGRGSHSAPKSDPATIAGAGQLTAGPRVHPGVARRVRPVQVPGRRRTCLLPRRASRTGR